MIDFNVKHLADLIAVSIKWKIRARKSLKLVGFDHFLLNELNLIRVTVLRDLQIIGTRQQNLSTLSFILVCQPS